jgi:hypothetical protein
MSVPPAGYKNRNPTSERLQTDALERDATAIGRSDSLTENQGVRMCDLLNVIVFCIYLAPLKKEVQKL